MKNKFLMVLLSAVIAFALWTYVITVVSPESSEEYYNVPVIMEGETLLNERGLMVVTENLPTARLKLFGNRTDLNKVNSSNITLKVNLTNIYDPGDYQLKYSVSYPGDIAPGALEIEESDPSYVTIRVEQQSTKEIPVNVVYQNAVPEDYIAHTDNDVLDYEKVTVIGPEPVIQQITEARIVIDLTERTASFSESYRYQLCDAEGNPVESAYVATNVAEVNVTLSIQRVKDIMLTVDVKSGGGATAATSSIVISPPTIKVCGSDSLLESLGDELLIGTIDLGALTSDEVLTFDLVIPNGITNLSEVTTVQVAVTFPDLQVRNFSVPAENFVFVNVPEGLDVEMITQQLSVTVRGPKALGEKMMYSDIIVTVDFTGCVKGNVKPAATITMGSGYGRVGALYTYTVSATLFDPAEVEEIDATGPDSEVQ